MYKAATIVIEEGPPIVLAYAYIRQHTCKASADAIVITCLPIHLYIVYEACV